MVNWSKNKIGRVGEYLVAAELEKQGFSTALTLKNAEDFDILAINAETHKQVAIQVKTTTKIDWPLTPRCTEIYSDNLFYVFVKMSKEFVPEFHIVKSEIVAKTVKKEHQEWLNKPGKNGHIHKDNTIRVWRDRENKYLNKWEDLQ